MVLCPRAHKDSYVIHARGENHRTLAPTRYRYHVDSERLLDHAKKPRQHNRRPRMVKILETAETLELAMIDSSHERQQVQASSRAGSDRMSGLAPHRRR